jgi:quercetin dioxygenase-like cupin family protein
MELYTHPHTIENGGSETLTFTGLKHDERGAVLEIENLVTGKGEGPPMHVHHLQHESVTVVEGALGWKGLDGVEHTAGAGETVTWAPGEVHKFWNAGDGPLRGRGEVWPPSNLEYFLTEVFESTARGGGERPGLFDIAFLTTRYGSEFEMVEIPAPVRKVLVPVVYGLGRLLGRHKRFAGAPEPLTTAGRDGAGASPTPAPVRS